MRKPKKSESQAKPIRWRDGVDERAYDSSAEAITRAEQLAEPNEPFNVERYDASCEICVPRLARNHSLIRVSYRLRNFYRFEILNSSIASAALIRATCTTANTLAFVSQSLPGFAPQKWHSFERGLVLR
jgi:hypothetical protein